MIPNLIQQELPLGNAIIKLCEILKIRVPSPIIYRMLDDHPNYPSLLAVSDVLRSIGINNHAAEIEGSDIKSIDLPCICILRFSASEPEQLCLICSRKEDGVFFYAPGKSTRQFANWDNFLKSYKGITLIIERSSHVQDAIDINYKEAKVKQSVFNFIFIFFPILTFISIVVAFQVNGIRVSLLPAISTCLNLIGVFICGLLLIQELNVHNPFLKHICGLRTENGCRVVLQSKEAKFFGIRWSNIGFAFFFTLLMVSLLSSVTDKTAKFIIAWSYLPVIPFIFFSIYSQWKTIQGWCTLCVSVQVIIFSQVIICITGGFYSAISLSDLSFRSIAFTISIYIFTFSIPYFLLPALIKIKEQQIKLKNLTILSQDAGIFQAFLSRQKLVKVPPTNIGITIGNASGKVRIIKVCNPYCKPSAIVHPQLEQLVKSNEEVAVQIIFTASNNPDDIRYAPVQHLLALASINDEALIRKALNDWYSQPKKNMQSFVNKYPLPNGLGCNATVQIDAMSEWCKTSEIAGTPTFFINGRRLPNQYNPADLAQILTADNGF